ncbi:small RNA 2'-O-methyltransferase isoform X2 [Xiphias gladius]|nr:small RNA 2'-O-methyltransferase isoform X2 [Xiphias gladius]
MEPMFSPPLHRQRHQFVIDFVKRNKPKKVVDLGCSECILLKKLKFHREVELLVGVDINGTKVRKKMYGLAPISTDYLQPTYDQLRIELYQGSVTHKDARVRGFDLVTSIELIEHLTLADVERFSEVVFGYMTPAAVIVSTPNSDFNPLLPGLAGFRHRDHKFEWTRAEFRSWALKVCLEFGYEVELTGVGQAPSGQQEGVGFCSQIGVFHRLGGRDGCHMSLGDEVEDVFSYTLLYSVNYPSLHDSNILGRVLVSEVLYWAEKLKGKWKEEMTGEGNGAHTLRQPEGGEGCVSERCTEVEEKQTACGAEKRNLVEQCGKGASEDQEEEDEEGFWTNGEKRQDSSTLRRSVSVPLDVLWSCCPKVSALSGSLGNLRRLLMDDPQVKLSQDGAAVLVNDQELDFEEEEEDHNDLGDSGYAELGQRSHTAEQEEDWEANVDLEDAALFTGQ